MGSSVDDNNQKLIEEVKVIMQSIRKPVTGSSILLNGQRYIYNASTDRWNLLNSLVEDFILDTHTNISFTNEQMTDKILDVYNEKSKINSGN